MTPPSSTPAIPLIDMSAEYAEHGQSILSAIHRVVQSGKFILGPEVAALERKLASFVQGRSEDPAVHCIGVSDGTTALQLCLQALKIGTGDEVICPTFTWISTAEVVPLLGATPVFADIEPDTFVIDVERLSPHITARTRAVIVVSLFGLIPDLKGLRSVLDEAESKYGTRIHIIEDGAQSFGGMRGGYRSCGSPLASLSTTSFFPTKPLSCYGDGGAVFTRDEKLADIVRALRVHGKVDGLHQLVGVNGRLDTVQAAVLLAKMEYFEESLMQRRKAAERYNRLLQDDGRVILPTYKRVRDADETIQSANGVYTIRVMNRDAVLKRLKDVGVSCAIYYPRCCHQQPVFKGQAGEVGSLNVAELASEQVLSLPMHAYVAQNVQVNIVREIRSALDDLGITDPPRWK